MKKTARAVGGEGERVVEEGNMGGNRFTGRGNEDRVVADGSETRKLVDDGMTGQAERRVGTLTVVIPSQAFLHLFLITNPRMRTPPGASPVTVM